MHFKLENTGKERRPFKMEITRLNIIFLLLIASQFWPLVSMASYCVTENVLTLQYPNVYGKSYINSSISFNVYCFGICGLFQETMVAIENAGICYCSPSVSYSGLSYSNCTANCSDGSQCGGDISSITTYEMTSTSLGQTVLIPNISSTLNPANVLAGTEFNITVAPSVNFLAYWVDWGDGTPWLVNSTSHTYEIAGKYQIQVYWRGYSNVVARMTVTVHEAPRFSISCKNCTAVNQPINCLVQMDTMGYDYQLSYNTSNSTSFKVYSASIPASRIVVIGSLIPAAQQTSTLVTTTELTNGYIILGNSLLLSGGYLSRLHGRAYKIGLLEIYTANPSCTSGYYCGLTGSCSSTCSSDVTPRVCSSNAPLSSIYSSCCTTNCSAGTAPSSGWSFTRITTVGLNSTSFDFNISPIWIPEGSYLALSCKSILCGSATLYYSQLSHPTVNLVPPDINVGLASTLNRRYSINLVVIEHLPLNVTPTLTCLTPTQLPLSAVPKPFSAATEAYLYQSSLTLKYSISSQAISTIVTQNLSLICQQSILRPTFIVEIWIPVKTPIPYLYTFTQGAPIFSKINIDGIMTYDYYDDASLGYNLNVSLVYATVGLFNLTGNSSNLLGTVTYNSIVHVVPKIMSNWVISTTCPCFNVDYGVSLNLTLSGYSIAPWNATVTVTVMNDTGVIVWPSQFFDFGTFNVTGYTAPIVIQLKNKTIIDAGNYSLMVNISNEATNSSTNTSVTILEGLRDISAVIMVDLYGQLFGGMGPSQNMFVSNFTMHFWPKARTGKPTNWKVIINETGQQIAISNSAVSNMTFRFPLPGVYTLIFGGYNDYQQWVLSSAYPIQLVSDLEGLQINATTTAVTKPGQILMINLNFIVFTPLTCIVVDWGDGSKEAFGYQPQCALNDPTVHYNTTVFTPVVLGHVYNSESKYDINAKAYDGKNLFSDTYSTVIANIVCSFPTVKIISGSNLLSAASSFKRSLQLRLVASSSYVCNKTVPVIMNWMISQVNETTGVAIQDIPITANPLVPSWNNSQLSVPPLFLGWGTYKFTFNILIFASAMFNLTASDYTYIIVTKTPLYASMFNGGISAATRGFGQMLILNSTLSFDPDFYPTDSQLNVNWWCRQVSPQSGILPGIYDNTTTYPFVNNHSIPAPMVAGNAKLTGGGCFGVGDGALTNSSQIIFLNTASFVNPNAAYEIIMKVSKDTRVTFSSLKVTVTPYPPPNVRLSCDPSVCFPTSVGLIFNAQEKLMVIGNCSADCPTTPVYNWTITDNNGNPLNLKAPCESQPPPQNDANYICEHAFLTPTNGTIFAVSSSFFTLSNPNVNIFKITLYISDKMDHTAATGFAVLSVLRNLPPKDGKCSITKTFGYALVDKFPVFTSEWIDPEGIGINYYSFIISSNDTGQLVSQTIATSLQIETELILPVGNFSIDVIVVDILQASTTFPLGNATAIMPNQSQITAFDYTSKIAYLTSIGDHTTLTMMLGALSSIRDNAQWLSLDPSSLDNLTQSAMTDRITNIALLNSQQLQAVSSMDFATISQLSVGSNVVQQALSGIFNNKLGALTVDMSTRDAALDVLQTMAEKLSTVTASVSDLQSFLANSMDSFSALLIGINEISTSGSDAMVPPTDQQKAQTWDYDVDIGNDINLTVPLSYNDQLAKNVKATTMAASKQQIAKIYNTARSISYVIQAKSLPGELVQSLSPNGATMVTGKLSEFVLRKGYNISTSVMNASVLLPIGFCPSKYVIPNTDCKKIFGITLLIWPCISHFYPDSRKYLSDSSRTLDLEVNINGNIVNITNESLPIVFKIPRVDSQDSPQIISVNFTDSINAHQPLVYHNFQITNINSGYTLVVDTSANLLGNMIFLIDHERLPTINKYLIAVLLNDFSVDDNGIRSYFVDSLGNQNRTGRFFVGVGILKTIKQISNSTFLQKSDFLTTSQSPINYNFWVNIAGCYFFDETINEWSGRNVTIISAEPSLISCSTTHLTPFASGYSLVANTLNFDYIFAHAGFTNNLLTYMTIMILTSLLFIGMIWAYLMDRADLKLVGVIPLPDNKSDDKYLYEVTFRTGSDKEALTASNIWFIASGDYGETDVRKLPAGNRNLYRRFMVNSFVMATPKPLGHINFLRVFHDNSGEPPLDTWQLQMVVFRDLQTSEKSVFDTNAWLAFDRDEGKVDMTFTSSENEDRNDFDQNMYINSNRMVNENNIFMSMFLRSPVSRYNRKERVVVCAVFLYLSMALSTVFYQLKSDTLRNGYFDYGLLTVSSEQLITGVISLLLAYPATFILSFIFKRARPRKLKSCRALEAIEKQRILQIGGDNCTTIESSTQGREKSKDKSPVLCLPWWTRVLAWIAAITIIHLSIFIVWTLCLAWGEIKTVKWFSTFIVTFLLSILVTQWLKIFIMAFVSSIYSKIDLSVDDIDCDEELPGLKPGEEWNQLKFMDPLTRKKVHRIEGVDSSNPDIESLKVRLMKEREMHFTLRTLLVYIIFLTVIYILVNGRVDYNAALLQRRLTNALTNNMYQSLLTYKGITIADDWWIWAQSVILQQLRAQRNYNNAPPYGLRGFMNDQANRMMGYAIIRQIRSKRFNCAVPSPMNELIHHCSGVRTIDNEDTQDYCAGWTKNETFPAACQLSEFKYQTADQVQAFTTSGRLDYYSGGGYVFRISGPQNTVTNQLNTLQQHHWIDKNTRAVILEFSIYNANVNLFSTCMVNTEFSMDGGAVLSWRFEPVRLIKDSGFTGAIMSFAEIAFLGITAFSTLRELWNIKKQKCDYIKSYWNILELLLLMISYLTIGLYFYRYVLTQNALNIFNATFGNGYVRMDAAVMVDQYYLFCLAFIVFFSTMKLIKILQFNKRMNILAMTIKGCWDELKVFLIAFIIVFFAFASLFFFIFKTNILEYSQLITSGATTFQMMLGKSDLRGMTAANPMAPLLFFVFSLATTLLLINLMLSIILQSFQQVKKSLANMENKLNIIDFVWFNFKVVIRKERLKNIQVTPVFNDKKDFHHHSKNLGDLEANNLSSKVNQLMKYVNEVYFDGQLDLTGANAKKYLMQESDKYKFQPSNSSKRQVYSSDQ